MVGAVTRERTHGGAVFVTLALGQARSEVQFVGNLKPEQPVVELQRCRRIGNVDAEVSQPANPERAWQLHTADDTPGGGAPGAPNIV